MRRVAQNTMYKYSFVVLQYISESEILYICDIKINVVNNLSIIFLPSWQFVHARLALLTTWSLLRLHANNKDMIPHWLHHRDLQKRSAKSYDTTAT